MLQLVVRPTLQGSPWAAKGCAEICINKQVRAGDSGILKEKAKAVSLKSLMKVASLPEQDLMRTAIRKFCWPVWGRLRWKGLMAPSCRLAPLQQRFGECPLLRSRVQDYPYCSAVWQHSGLFGSRKVLRGWEGPKGPKYLL